MGRLPESLAGAPIVDLVHPDDVPNLLLAVTQTITSRRSAITRLRVRAGEGWRDATGFIAALCEHQPPRLGMAVSTVTPHVLSGAVSRSAELEGHLVRIAAEVLAAGLLPEVDWTSSDVMANAFADLTSRQLEIVTRLIRGERVPEIAKAMFLSPSTIRNHLTAVFRRFDVHSQGELISLIRDLSDATHRAPQGSPPT
jgi:DNA-binding CsgD family transcriptional regulator